MTRHVLMTKQLAGTHRRIGVVFLLFVAALLLSPAGGQAAEDYTERVRGSVRLEPGETLSREAALSAPPEPGRYQLVACLASDGVRFGCSDPVEKSRVIDDIRVPRPICEGFVPPLCFYNQCAFDDCGLDGCSQTPPAGTQVAGSC